ncbi:M23 family metallopeptidase [Mangrovivirga cuniculi]|uniref:Peptidase M23 n=1 Tax=Mangrovivirga cuniculi TaxID=2715131 RepID=A0A4D7JVN4_9BACT|nr:M23 family metallopeptidase [Mangrovivirga cuniculi]QCK14875.1 peptidase M23 [Mangrovivirga cuniculi]
MARIKYYYDTETCKYERVKVSTWDVVLNFMGFMFVSVLIAFGLVLAYFFIFDSPKEQILKQENRALRDSLNNWQREISLQRDYVAYLQQRDERIYRQIMEADPLPSSVREMGMGGADRYKKYRELDLPEVLTDTRKKIDKLNKEMYAQSLSFDEIEELAENKNKMLASIPAIQPIRNKELTRLASGYGLRMHPIYKVRKMHWGIDFSAPRGTPIYSTGDGKISRVVRSNKRTGYGNYVEIDHGYGFKTRYAHMQTISVRVGQKVSRGETIGKVGNTGGSTAPHCHYEIMKDGKKVDPILYMIMDVTDEEYQKLLDLASIENQSLG